MVDLHYQFQPERFANMKTPTLLLEGGDSPELFKNGIKLLNVTLPNSKVVVFPGQQHIAMDLEPELFASKVIDFIRETGLSNDE